MVEPNIVVIGGGTGSFTLLSSLKMHTNNITALVNMVDDGGSTGVLRDELGVLPPGDVRQCLVALSESSSSLRELFNFRFPEGGTMAGHSFGNLFLSAVEKMSSNFGEAVELASEVLNITGRVVPITLQNCHLVIEIDNMKIKGEYAISVMELPEGHKPILSLEPQAAINPIAKEAIKNADLIVIAPGNLYGSLIPALLVSGVKEALLATKAPIAYVCNLVNKPTQTKDYSVTDYVHELERFISPGRLDCVLYNTDEPDAQILESYALEGEYPITINKKQMTKLPNSFIPGHFLNRNILKRNENDSFILRSLMRHDAEAVSRALLKIIKT